MWIVGRLCLVATILLIVALASGGLVAQTPSSTPLRRVLVLYSDERLLPSNIILDEAIRTTFASDTSDRIEFHSEFLDVTRFPGEAQQERRRDFLRDKYRERSPDLAIAVAGPALEFLLKYRATLFADVPIVYCAVPAEALPKEMPDAKIVGVPVLRAAASTLELALRLQPDTRNVAVVAGSSLRDLESAEQFRRETQTFERGVGFTWLTNLSLPDLRGELSRLPDHTVVLYLTMFQDARGAFFTPRQALTLFAPASRAAIYGFRDTYLGYGVVGGSIVTFEKIGREAAGLGIRILLGEDAQAAAQSESSKAAPMFDWRELQRWNISEKRLPPGSIVRFKRVTYWEQHYRFILGAGSLCALEAFLIGGLLVQLRRRRLAERSLRESEQRMSLSQPMPPTLASRFGISGGTKSGPRTNGGSCSVSRRQSGWTCTAFSNVLAGDAESGENRIVVRQKSLLDLPSHLKVGLEQGVFRLKFLGGDFFDIFSLSQTRVGILICDVVGHGLRGTLVTSVIRALLEELRPMMHNAGRFLGALNLRLRAVLERVDEPFLATAFYMIADTASKEVSFANAGHPDPVRLRRQAGIVESLSEGRGKAGPALGR